MGGWEGGILQHVMHQERATSFRVEFCKIQIFRVEFEQILDFGVILETRFQENSNSRDQSYRFP